MDSASDQPVGSRHRLRHLYRFMAGVLFVAHRDELTRAGFGRRQIDNWIRSGRLFRAMHSVYAFGRDVETREAAWRAAILAAGEGSALIGRSACQKWGLVRGPEGIPGVVEVGSPTGQSRMLRGKSPALRRMVVKVASRHFEANEVCNRDGIPVVNPVLALIGLAESASDRELRFAFLEACRLNLFRKGDLESCYRKLLGRRGARKLRPYLTLWVPELSQTKSVLEGWFLLVWVKRRLAMPRVNEKVFGVEVDFYWPQFDLVLETDGEAFHRGPVQKQIDFEKQRFLESKGLTVLRTTFKEFAADPNGVVEHVISRQHPGEASRLS